MWAFRSLGTSCKHRTSHRGSTLAKEHTKDKSKALTQRADVARPRPEAPEQAPGALPKHPANHVVSLQPGGAVSWPCPPGTLGLGEHRAREPPVTHGGSLTKPGMGHPVCLPFPTKKARAQHWAVAGPTAVITWRTDLAQASGPA